MKPTQAGRYAIAAPDGTAIRGTVERISGIAECDTVEIEAEGYVSPEYSGHTEVFWDGQMTETNAEGEVLYEDVHTNEWKESELVYTLIVEDNDA